MNNTKILIIGANGQVGSVLIKALQKVYGDSNVIGSDIFVKSEFVGSFEILDATNKSAIKNIVKKYSITEIYHLAAILSVKGEENPLHTWDLNTKMMLNVFEVARETKVKKVFFPSSIAVFGDQAPKTNTLQHTILNPTTVYGISKSAGESWALYYYNNYGLDVRSIRYPGIIGYQSMPGGGTTDYAVDIYHSAVKREVYSCFLKADTKLPMIYMDDAINATIKLMQAPAGNISIRTSYNLGSMSFSPADVSEEIRKKYTDFKIIYDVDFRQSIADKWPDSIDDSQARKDWNWKPAHDLESMSCEMLEKLEEKYNYTT